MQSKYKIGDRFVKKNSRDSFVMNIVEVRYGPIEPEYKLRGVNNLNMFVYLGESGLEELYTKIN